MRVLVSHRPFEYELAVHIAFHDLHQFPAEQSLLIELGLQAFVTQASAGELSAEWNRNRDDEVFPTIGYGPVSSPGCR